MHGIEGEPRDRNLQGKNYIDAGWWANGQTRQGNIQRSELGMFQWIGPTSPLPSLGMPPNHGRRWVSMAVANTKGKLREACEACLVFQGLPTTTSRRTAGGPSLTSLHVWIYLGVPYHHAYLINVECQFCFFPISRLFFLQPDCWCA